MLVSFLLASSLLPSYALAHSSHSHATTRRSVAFGPALDHSTFRALDPEPDSSALPRDPFEIARRLPGVEGEHWYIRDDSYTDKATRITHVYVRQLVDGLEVVDGDINLNIHDGQVLSEGNSFFFGDTPSIPVTSAVERCARLQSMHTTTTAHLRALLSKLSEDDATERLLSYGHDQLSFSTGGSYAAESASDVDEEEVDWLLSSTKALFDEISITCDAPNIPSRLFATLFSASIPTESAQLAALAFLAAVTPSSQLSADLNAAPERFLSALSTTSETSLLPGSVVESTTLLIRGAPETVSPVKARLAWQQTDDGALALVWRLEVEMVDNWYEASVTADSGTILRVIDWVSDGPTPRKTKRSASPSPRAEYNVWAWGINDPSEGNRTFQTDPHDVVASPAGWHAYPSTGYAPFLSSTPGITLAKGWMNTTTTLGNNVFAQENFEGSSSWIANHRPSASNLSFDYDYGREEGLRPKEYIDLAVTQLFYTCNMFHDLTYRLGFDELAGNFQQSNFGKGGREGDAVIAWAQSGEGQNNANFATPPDGSPGRMRMYTWNTATPYLDGDLEAGIVIHEFAHGLSTRLTGGPANSGCLGYGESGGMGEGWGDYLATQIRKTSKYSDYAMGSWAANRAGGIRNYPYSLNATVNPSTYATLDRPGYYGVHAIGEVWAQFLFVLTEALIAEHGFSSTLFPPVDPSVANPYYRTLATYTASGELATPLVPVHGNTLAVQLVINGMKLQPCRPSFADARDAIVEADKHLTGGENVCTIWTSFASKGLGVDAGLIGGGPWGGGRHHEDSSIPRNVCSSDKKKKKAAPVAL